MCCVERDFTLCHLIHPNYAYTYISPSSNEQNNRIRCKKNVLDSLLFHLNLEWMFVSCVRSRGGVPPLHAAVPRGAAPRGAPPSRAPSSRGRGVQRARGAPPAAGYRPAPPIVQDTYGEYVSILNSGHTVNQVNTKSPLRPCIQIYLCLSGA